jgi:hypothetical protein
MLNGDRLKRQIFLAARAVSLIFGAAGCTSMGIDHPALRDSINFGPPREVRMCVYLDDGITSKEATDLLESWADEASIYNLYIRPASFGHLRRGGFFHSEILDQVTRIPLGRSCDRVLYFVNRSLGDVAYGLASAATGLPEVLGEVDDVTLTHGFVFARSASVNQLVMTPSIVTRHELFHLLGCPQHFDMQDCYRRIESLKNVETRLLERGYYDGQGEEPFYPTFASRTDSMLLSRAQVDGYARQNSDSAAAATAR